MTDKGVTPEDDQPSTSLSLLERARSGDELAWQQALDLYSPLVYSWCRRAGLQPADSEDVSSEVFRAVHRKLGDFRRDREGDSFRGWLRTFTRNKIKDWYEKNRRFPQGHGGTDGTSFLDQLPDDSDEPEEERKSDRDLLFMRALEVIRSGFEEQTWRMFWMVAVEDRAPDDVASELKTTVNAVYLAKCRVLKRLREEFQDLIDDLPGSDPNRPC